MPRKHLDEYPNQIRLWRDAVGITQEELGRRVGLTKTQISRLELGQRELGFKQARLVAIALGVNAADLMVAQDNPWAADAELMLIVKNYKLSSDEGRHNIAAVADSTARYNNGPNI